MTRKIAIIVSGGDCGGINDTIAAIGRAAMKLGYECIGFREGWEGLLDRRVMPLNADIFRMRVLHTFR